MLRIGLFLSIQFYTPPNNNMNYLSAIFHNLLSPSPIFSTHINKINKKINNNNNNNKQLPCAVNDTISETFILDTVRSVFVIATPFNHIRDES